MLGLPFVDLRPFSDQGRVARLARPAWPLPELGYEFVRRFGQVKKHPAKSSVPWAGEHYYCDASRLIVFNQPLRAMVKSPKIQQLSRRLFTDGVVGRAELEFRASYVDDSQYVAKQVAGLKVRVGKSVVHPVIESAGRIAAEYASATLPVALRGHGATPIPRFVVPGTPMIVVERFLNSKPRVLEGDKPDLRLAMDHRWSYVGDSQVALWTISYTSSAQKEDVEHARRHAVRLHSEMEAFAAVLRACRSGLLKNSESDVLNEYLYTTARRLLKNKYDDWPQVEILRSIASSRRTTQSAELMSLEQAFNDVKPGMLHMLKDASALYENGSQDRITVINQYANEGDVSVMISDNSVNIGAGAQINGLVGSNNTITGSSVGGGSADDISVLVGVLHDQLRNLENELTGDELDYAEIIENQVCQQPLPSGKVRMYLERILTGIQKIGEAGLPVAKTVSEIAKILPS